MTASELAAGSGDGGVLLAAAAPAAAAAAPGVTRETPESAAGLARYGDIG